MAIANTILHCVITWHVASLWFVPGYNSSIVESDIKHHNLNPYPYITNIRYVLVIIYNEHSLCPIDNWGQHFPSPMDFVTHRTSLCCIVYVHSVCSTLQMCAVRKDQGSKFPSLDRSIYDINQWNNIYLQMRSCIYAVNPWRVHRQVKKEWKKMYCYF